MIEYAEVLDFANRFGVPADQIRRDHLISHVLNTLASATPDHPGEFVFFGGTALCRTWLPDLRLSEDIDLLVDSMDGTEQLRRSISLGLRREFPATWTKVGSRDDVDTWNLAARNLTVKIEFVLWRQRWKETLQTASNDVQLRYSDLPESVPLIVPTASAFAAMKLMAWTFRAAPRDIYDLAALAEAGMIDHAALRSVDTITGHTPTSRSITNVAMGQVRDEWSAELDHQLGDPKSFDECVALVRQALEAHEA